MNRKEFLTGAGLAGLGLALPGSNTLLNAPVSKAKVNDSCVLIPSETAGPFPLDLTENPYYLRQDVRESQPGVLLNLKLKILGVNNCQPMENVRVNIWHCTNEGVYSGYNNQQNPGDANSKYLRGYQFTDVHGEVEFITVFPGWYNGRIAHIHFQVHVSSNYSAVSQLTFNIADKNALYLANPTLYPKGADPLSYAQDNVFSDGVTYQVATLTPNQATGGYDSYMEVSVQGSGVSGVGHIEKETAKVFELGQNFPNPYTDKTTVPVTIKEVSDIKLELWNLSGQKVATVFEAKGAYGDYNIDVNPSAHGLPNGNYMYQLEAKNSRGVYRLPKMMTVLK